MSAGCYKGGAWEIVAIAKEFRENDRKKLKKQKHSRGNIKY